MRLAACLLCFLVVITACSKVTEITPADKQYLLVPAEIEHFPIERYRQKTAWDQVSYIFFKTYAEQFGFWGLYGTILISPGGGEVKYLCLVNIPTTIDQARDLSARLMQELSPRDFGKEETLDPGLYRVDEVYLYTDNTSYFHLVLRSSRIVYSILLDGARLEEPQVREGLRNKLVYLQQHVNMMR